MVMKRERNWKKIRGLWSFWSVMAMLLFFPPLFIWGKHTKIWAYIIQGIAIQNVLAQVYFFTTNDRAFVNWVRKLWKLEPLPSPTRCPAMYYTSKRWSWPVIGETFQCSLKVNHEKMMHYNPEIGGWNRDDRSLN